MVVGLLKNQNAVGVAMCDRSVTGLEMQMLARRCRRWSDDAGVGSLIQGVVAAVGTGIECWS